MTGIALVRRVSTPPPARRPVPFAQSRPAPEHVEEVWDAELVGDLPRPGWLAGPALTTYARAGFAMRAPLVDLRA